MGDFVLSWNLENDNNTIGEEVQVNIYVQCKKQIPTTDWYLVLQDGKSYFVPEKFYCLAPSASFTVKMKLRVFNTATIDTLPSSIVVSLMDQHDKLCTSVGIGFNMCTLSATLN